MGQMGKRKYIRQITDARGRTVTQLDPFTLRLTWRFDVIPREDLDVIAREIGSGLEKGPRVLLIVGLVCLAISVAVVAVKVVRMLSAGGFSLYKLAGSLSPFLSTWACPFVLWLGACVVRSQKSMRIMLAHRRCPHCGYDLRGSPADATDGATVCPECGCAWRMAS
jgi:hypothetical protein